MRFNRRSFITSLIIITLVALLVGYRLPYYIYKPGTADALNPVVQVKNGFESEGDMHLVTVRGGQATPIEYILASVMPYREIEPIENVFPHGISKEAYFQAQLQMMESSQQASTVVAYQAANKEINITYNGVYVVSVIEDMPAEGILKAGDKIVQIDDIEVKQTNELINYVTTKEPGDSIELIIDRNGKKLNKTIKLDTFPGMNEKVGIGIQLVTDREVKVNPSVAFSSGDIGGPSAGLMFSLEIYDQLTEEDLTKGYQIAGTGEISYEGEVGRIGGIDKKVIAADREGSDIFFAPNENGADDSNYEIAKATAKEIGTDMKIVPVDTFDDALNYLKALEPKG